MQLSIKHLKGYRIEAVDGEVGHVDSFLFEDTTWNIRYLVVNTGPFFFGEKVLLSPQCVTRLDKHGLMVNLSMEKIRHSPSIDTDQPVSRRMEKELHQFYQWPYYWDMNPEIDLFSSLMPVDEENDEEENSNGQHGNPHLRSTSAVLGYSVTAQKVVNGTLNDFIVNTDTWNIPFAIVETMNARGRKNVLIITEWIKNILWQRETILVDVPGRVLQGLPQFSPHSSVNRIREEVHFDYYGIPTSRQVVNAPESELVPG